MTQSLDASLIRIFDPHGKPVGVGFMIANRLAVTCAHVLGQLNPDEIKVDFPRLPENPVAESTVSDVALESRF